MSNQFKENDAVFMMVDSKARGNWGTVNQLAGVRGLMVKPDGELIELPPVKSSFKQGLSVLEYFDFNPWRPQRLIRHRLKNGYRRYLTRRLVDVAQDVVAAKKTAKTKRILPARD